jgi:ethanolamine utilization protein EutP
LKRLLLIGRTMCGKTTLTQRILKEDIVYHKTQTMNLAGKFIYDTPGEYLERKAYRAALTVASADADIMVFMQDATEDGTYFPPMYSALFGKPVIGLVTKCDIATEKQIDMAKMSLRLAGVKKIFIISSITGEGVADFVKEIGLNVSEIKGKKDDDKKS